MDHQASESSFKVSLKKRSQFFLAVGLYVLSLPFTVLTCFADDPAPNPLIENITVTAIVLQNPSINPDTPPISNTGPINLVNTSDVAIFKGMAYPGSIISLLKNGILLANVPANPNGSFELHVRNLDPGTYTFGVRAQDATGLTSKLLTFTIFISTSVATVVEGIFIPPTITSDKIEVKKGSPITFLGASAPNAEVRLSLTLDGEVVKKIQANASGTWIYSIDSSLLTLGDYTAKARALTVLDLSPFSDPLTFRVGDTNRNRPKISSLSGFRKRCDLNDDGRVNLLDFSIMAFWYKRLTFPPKVDLNSDKNVNLTDLSILAYCWTG